MKNIFLITFAALLLGCHKEQAQVPKPDPEVQTQAAITDAWQKIHQCKVDATKQVRVGPVLDEKAYIGKIKALDETAMPEDFRMAFEKFRASLVMWDAEKGGKGQDLLKTLATIKGHGDGKLKRTELTENILEGLEAMRVVSLAHSVQPPP